MVSAISQYGVLYDSNGILIDRGSTIGNDSQSLTLNQRKCLTEVLLQKKIDDEDFLKRTVFETLIQLAAVRQTFKVSLADTTLGSANLFISWSAVSSRIPLHYVADYSLLRIVNHNDDQRAESVLLPVTYSSLCTCAIKYFFVYSQVVKNLSVEQKRTEYKALEFLSHPQLFFIAYAQVRKQETSGGRNEKMKCVCIGMTRCIRVATHLSR